MKKIFTLIIILIVNTSALSAKETKKINSDICKDAIKIARISGYTGSGDYNIRFILEKNKKLHRYTVNKHWTECYNIYEKRN